MSYYKQTQLSPLTPSQMRNKNYAKYDKYGYRVSKGSNKEINTIVAFFN